MSNALAAIAVGELTEVSLESIKKGLLSFSAEQTNVLNTKVNETDLQLSMTTLIIRQKSQQHFLR